MTPPRARAARAMMEKAVRILMAFEGGGEQEEGKREARCGAVGV
jgi:hypothetical protein